jgi:signal transduction histidine kinase
MDAQAETHTPTVPTGARPPIEPAEIRSILTTLSQELSRPLVSLRMGCDLLLAEPGGPISPDQRGHVETMVVLCDDLLRLTRSYLDYAGLVHGTRALCYCEFTVGALIREIDLQFARSAAEARVGWGCMLEGRDAAVTTDATRCQQLFGNLVANAIKFTPEGGAVSVTGRVEAAHWVVTVSDDGPGIPPEHSERVFEPFFRLGREDHSRPEGNGLGLAVCRELVAQLDGEISLQPRPDGRGTQVTVRLPVDTSKQVPAGARGRR